MRNFALRAAIVALALAVVPSGADASFIPGFTGNTQMGTPGARADGVVNFAVWDNINNDFAAFYAAATGGLSITNDFGSVAASRYIYVYQVVNTNPVGSLADDSDLEALFVARVTGSTITASGYGNGAVFSEGGNAVGPAGNTRLGLEGNDFDPTLNGVPSQSGVVTAGITANAGAGNILNIEEDEEFPTSTGGLIPTDGTPAVQFNYVARAPGQYTSLMFLGALDAPQYYRGTLTDGQNTFGDVPVPSPEPATMGLIALGVSLMGGLGMARRLRKGRGADATAEVVA